MGSISQASVKLQRNLSFAQNYQKGAVRKTNVKSRVEFARNAEEKNQVNPEIIGRLASRTMIRTNANMTPQDRFVEFYA